MRAIENAPLWITIPVNVGSESHSEFGSRRPGETDWIDSKGRAYQRKCPSLTWKRSDADLVACSSEPINVLELSVIFRVAFPILPDFVTLLILRHFYPEREICVPGTIRIADLILAFQVNR
jgi:hypothetical protein